ncbi:cation-translocating P-type ATPase [Hymenobacter sp. PAMC 26628]|uniref:cation-translocating P-type ATPase n=1 Tax=Hymenobacter sp. PAMC 26628 TaxID=1484118 RepID=UPI00076FFFA0|nr:cation-translocating P-type ATPase [Hymenobacter sp. PAMC 26628]AMJ65995.1 ATPase [Hymenobacter sp. PAMC 26628]
MEYYLASVAEVAHVLRTTPAGLDAATARQRLAEYGPNQLPDPQQKAWWQLLRQFTDVMILVLLAAAGIAAVVGDAQSTYVILAIVGLNALMGFGQEYRAGKAMSALQQLAVQPAQVLRGGQPRTVNATDLVPGDTVLLEAGDVISADVRFLEVHALQVDESSLTGESANVAKNTAPLPAGEYPLGDRLNLSYKGTSVTNGRATAYVVATGPQTELGKIAALLQTAETLTPLQQRLATLSKALSAAILVICVLFFGTGWLRGEPLLPWLLVSVSLAVAAIPEALPALVSITLALGARWLSQNHALVRKLPAVETLGSVTYICTDKTGTLTLNKMTTQQVYANPAFTLPALGDADALLTAMALNTDASHGPDDQWLGDSTEVALARYAAEKAYPRPVLEARFPRLAELPFDAERKCMTTLHQTPQGILVLTKGAPGVLFAQLAADQKGQLPDLEQHANAQAALGFRVLAYAAKLLPALPTQLDAARLETGLACIGLASLIDPPRPEATQAVAECRAAGIIPVMITGDHALTAQAVARQLGILAAADELVLTGPELAKLTEPAFGALVEKVRVYARMDPAQKVRIVRALQARHQCVAMTGDGVNDAPALKQADIGIAMGRSGTEVAKEAADMLLLDDDFATIVQAVQRGRRVYDNILKFIRYILSGSVGEIGAVFLAPYLGLPLPVLAIQILWINLVTDGLSLALAYEPAEANSMRRPPLNPQQSIFAAGLGWFILGAGLLLGSLTLGLQAWAMRSGLAHWQSMVFTMLLFSQLGLGLAVRSRWVSLFSLGLLSNKPLLGALLLSVGLQLLLLYVPFFNHLFHTQPLSWGEMGITVAVSSLVFWAVEGQKLFSRWRAVPLPVPALQFMPAALAST